MKQDFVGRSEAVTAGRVKNSAMMPDFAWQLPYPSQRMPVLARNVVATSQPLAAQAACACCSKGGNAVDAALATAIALTVVEPTATASAATPSRILWDGKRAARPERLGPLARGWTPERFARPERDAEARLGLGHRAGLRVGLGRAVGNVRQAAVRGAVRAGDRLRAATATWCRRRSRGCGQARCRELKTQPGFAEAFMPRRPRAASRASSFVFPTQARDARSASPRRSGEAFYAASSPNASPRTRRQHGGAMTTDDSPRTRADWVEPIAHRLSRLHAARDPAQRPGHRGADRARHPRALRPAQRCRSIRADSLHLQIEAMKLAFADVYALRRRRRRRCASSPRDLLDKDYLERAREADRHEARAAIRGTARPARGGTVYLTAADADGMMVSYIQSNYMGFGSGVVVAGTGISLQNRGDGFVLRAGPPERGRRRASGRSTPSSRLRHAGRRSR